MLDTATTGRHDPSDADPTSEVRIKIPAEGTVRFRDADGDRGISARLHVEVPQAWDVLGATYRALFDLRVQVVQLRTRVVGGRRQFHLDLAEFDGARLDDRRRRSIRGAIVQLLQDSRSARLEPPSEVAS